MEEKIYVTLIHLKLEKLYNCISKVILALFFNFKSSYSNAFAWQCAIAKAIDKAIVYGGCYGHQPISVEYICVKDLCFNMRTLCTILGRSIHNQDITFKDMAMDSVHI